MWNFKDLQVREGTLERSKRGKGTVNVPTLFPDSSVGIPKPISGRIGTDALQVAPKNAPPAFRRCTALVWISHFAFFPRGVP